MDLSTGTRVTASNTVPFHARYTAGRTHGNSLNADKEVSDVQPPDTEKQLASTEPSKTEVTASDIGRPSNSNSADRSTGTAETPVTKDSDRPGRSVDDSGYGPSLWTAELGTPGGSRSDATGADSLQYGSIFIQIFAVGSENTCILKLSAKWPFNVIQGH